MDSIKKLLDEVKTAKAFSYLGDKLNASSGCEMAVTARARIGWMRFRKGGQLLLENRFRLKTKDKVYCYCVRSATLWRSETRRVRKNEKQF